MHFPSSRERASRLFPVKSSAPVTRTMHRPKGNRRPETIRASPTFSIPWTAVLVAAQPRAMRAPARTERARSFPAGLCVLAVPAAA